MAILADLPTPLTIAPLPLPITCTLLGEATAVVDITAIIPPMRHAPMVGVVVTAHPTGEEEEEDTTVATN